jgi:hypothetical protein
MVKVKRLAIDSGFVLGLTVLLLSQTTAGAQEATKAGEYRPLTQKDGFSCTFSQDLSVSMTSPGLSGNMAATRDHFDCTDKEGKKRSIELTSTGLVNGKVEIKTRDFGTILRGNEQGTFDRYEMMESQIKKLKAFLGF